MIRQYELVEKVQAYNPQTNDGLLNKAYVYAMRRHSHQRRESGESYFTHPLEVANILTELKLDDATIVAALLHDTLEDTDATRAEIDDLFGTEIGALVDGLTKIDRLKLVSREVQQAENLRKLLLAISQDVRVLLVKLADRLHNMRTLGSVSQEKKKRISHETLDIYAPLAGRIGMQDMRSELEDLAFQNLQPGQYKAITSRLAELQSMHKETIYEVENILREKLKDYSNGALDAHVTGRLKMPYSIFKKMERKSISLEQLSDIIGFRIVVDNVDQCYQALGFIHTAWPLVPGRFKDYISAPKKNDYQSIHTTVIGPERQRVELQIRTKKMHQIADFGVAAHALYKDGFGQDMKRLEAESKAYEWLRATIAHLMEGDNPQEFLEHTKLELFQDQVFCFTPRGRLIALPRGATPIDFAYAVHTDIGDSCVGARINGKIKPLISRLRNGDEVEITRNVNQKPPAVWEHIVVTGKAKAALRKATRLGAQEKIRHLGATILQSCLARGRKSSKAAMTSLLLKSFELETEADLQLKLGKGELTAQQIQSLLADSKDEFELLGAEPITLDDEGWFKLHNARGFRFKFADFAQSRDFFIGDIHMHTAIRMASHDVLPGDRVVGIFEPEQGIIIYALHAEELAHYQDHPHKWLDVKWVDNEAPQQSRIRLTMMAFNAPGMLAQISRIMAEKQANIEHLDMHAQSPDFHQLSFEIRVSNLVQLNDIIHTLEQCEGLTKIKRDRHGEQESMLQSAS